MPLGKAEIVLTVAVVALVVGFVVPEMYSGMSDVNNVLPNGSMMTGFPMAIIALSVISIFVVIAVVIVKVIRNA